MKMTHMVKPMTRRTPTTTTTLDSFKDSSLASGAAQQSPDVVQAALPLCLSCLVAMHIAECWQVIALAQLACRLQVEGP